MCLSRIQDTLIRFPVGTADWFGQIPAIRTQIRQEVLEMELQEMKLKEMHYDDETVHYM